MAMNDHKSLSLARKKPHHVPKMSTEAQIVLQEIRSVDKKSNERTASELQQLFSSSASASARQLPNVLSSTHLNNNATQEVTEGERYKDIECPFVLTMPGFDIRYNMAALRPVRESPQEKERNICIQKNSIEKCKEWLRRI